MHGATDRTRHSGRGDIENLGSYRSATNSGAGTDEARARAVAHRINLAAPRPAQNSDALAADARLFNKRHSRDHGHLSPSGQVEDGPRKNGATQNDVKQCVVYPHIMNASGPQSWLLLRLTPSCIPRNAKWCLPPGAQLSRSRSIVKASPRVGGPCTRKHLAYIRKRPLRR